LREVLGKSDQGFQGVHGVIYDWPGNVLYDRRPGKPGPVLVFGLLILPELFFIVTVKFGLDMSVYVDPNIVARNLPVLLAVISPKRPPPILPIWIVVEERPGQTVGMVEILPPMDRTGSFPRNGVPGRFVPRGENRG
jgi:hypothetical protein